MPKAINIPVLQIAVFGVVAVLLTGCSAESRKARLLVKADAYFKVGDYEKAEIEYKNVIQASGLDPTAVGRLGIIYFEQARLVRTGTYLLKAVELQPENLEVRLKAGYYHLAVGKAADAREAALAILERDPKHGTAPFLLAESTVQARDVADARSRLQAMPVSAPVLAALAVLDIRTSKPKEAEAKLEQALQTDPANIQALLTRGQLYLSLKDFARANAAFSRAAENSPARSSARIQYIQFNLQSDKVDVAKRLLDEMISKTPDFLPGYVLRSVIATKEKRYDEALTLLEKLLAREPFHPEALLLTAENRMAQGEKEKALATLDRAVEIFAQAPNLHFQRGTILTAMGDLVKATESFAEAVRLAPDYQPAILALAQAQIRQRMFAPAIDSLLAFRKKYPTNAESHLLLADAYRNQGNLDAALVIYRQLAEAAPSNAQVLFLTGTILAQQEKKAEARSVLGKAVELAPDYLPPLELLLGLELGDKQIDAARIRMERLIAQNPLKAPLHLLLAKVYLRQSDTAKAEAALLKSVELQPDIPDAHQLLAQLYLNTKQIDKALRPLQSAVAKTPKDFSSWILIGVLMENKKEYAAARDAYEKALIANPKAIAAINNLAYLLLEQFGDLDTAQKLAQKGRDLMPNQSESADTLGWILYKRRQFARALPLLEESAEKLSGNAEVQFHLGMAYYMSGEEEDARRTLERALLLDKDFPGSSEARECMAVLALDPGKDRASARATLEQAVSRRKDDPVALARLAVAYELEGNPDGALNAFETALKANASNVNAALNVIRLYRVRKEIPKALALAKATRALVPADGRIAQVLGQLTFETGDHLRAVGILQEAARRIPTNADVQFDLAEALYSVGQVAGAETAWRTGLQLAPYVTRSAGAHRSLEMIGLTKGPRKASEAIAAIEAALTAEPANVPSLMAKAVSDEHRGDAKAAKAGYEKVLAQYPNFFPATRSLAILYSIYAGDDKKALEVATKAREAFTTDQDVAKALGIILYRQANFARAAILLQESSRSRSSDPEVMYYLGMSQRQNKDHAAGNRSLQRSLDLGLTGNLAVEARKTLTQVSK